VEKEEWFLGRKRRVLKGRKPDSYLLFIKKAGSWTLHGVATFLIHRD
jgi:hypothetical protein